MTRFLKILFALCLCLFLLAGFSVSAPPEEPESIAAVSSFQESDFPSDMLRQKITKTEYAGNKDIIMGTFSYTKNKGIFRTISIPYRIETLGESPSQEELNAIWKKVQSNNPTKPDNRYDITGNFDNHSNPAGTTVTKYEDGREIWSYTDKAWAYLSGFGGYVETENGIYVYGTDTASEPWAGKVLLLSNAGTLLWEKTCKNNEGSWTFDEAVADGGGIVLFGSREVRDKTNHVKARYVTIRKYSAAGDLVWSKDNPVGGSNIMNAAVSLGDSYIIKLWDSDGGSKLVAVSKNGEFAERYTYSIDGKNYAVQDIAVNGDTVYLSCMAMNLSKDEFNASFKSLLQEYYDACQNTVQASIDMPEEYNSRLTKLFQEQYTAALFVCGKDGTVKNMQLVENARAGTLTVTDGVLSQQIFRIDDARNSSMQISAYRGLLHCTEFTLQYDTDGNLTSKSEIGPYSATF